MKSSFQTIKFVAGTVLSVALAIGVSGCTQLFAIAGIKDLDAAYARGAIGIEEYTERRSRLVAAYQEAEAEKQQRMLEIEAQHRQGGPGLAYMPYPNQSEPTTGGGFVPPPQIVYVPNQSQPTTTGGFVPPPQIVYVPNQPQAQPTTTGGFVPPPQIVYVPNKPQSATGGGFVPPPQTAYVPNNSSQGNKPQQIQPAHRYDLNGRPLTMTDAQLRQASADGKKRTGSFIDTTGNLVKSVESGNLPGVIKYADQFKKQAAEQAKDLVNPTQRTGLTPPGIPGAAQGAQR